MREKFRHALNDTMKRFGQVAGVRLQCYCAGDSAHADQILITAVGRDRDIPYLYSVAWFHMTSAVQNCDAQRCSGKAGKASIKKITSLPYYLERKTVTSLHNPATGPRGTIAFSLSIA